MSEGVATIARYFPEDFLILAFTAGVFTIFLSPVRFFFPASITNPLAVNSSETISNFIVIALLSVVLGIPVSLMKTLLLSNNGLNEKMRLREIMIPLEKSARALMIRLRKMTPSELSGEKSTNANETEPLNPEETGFHKWINESGYGSTFKGMIIKDTIAESVIFGSEISIFLWILLTVPICLILRLDLLSSIVQSWLAFVACAVALLLTCLYNRWYWRKAYDNGIKNLVREFRRASSRCQYCGKKLEPSDNVCPRCHHSRAKVE